MKERKKKNKPKKYASNLQDIRKSGSPQIHITVLYIIMHLSFLVLLCKQTSGIKFSILSVQKIFPRWIFVQKFKN